QFKPFLGRFGGPCYQLNLGIIWTDSEGIEYPRGKSNRRRRKLTRNWWNYQWLSRITGLISWITDGQRETDILITKYGSVRIATSPIRVTCPMAINEDLGSRGESEDAEDELLEDLSEEETEADDDADDE